MKYLTNMVRLIHNVLICPYIHSSLTKVIGMFSLAIVQSLTILFTFILILPLPHLSLSLFLSLCLYLSLSFCLSHLYFLGKIHSYAVIKQATSTNGKQITFTLQVEQASNHFYTEKIRNSNWNWAIVIVYLSFPLSWL